MSRESLPIIRNGFNKSDFIPLSPPHLTGEQQIFVQEAFKTNWIAPSGPNVDGFEREVAEMFGLAGAAALSSGTAAIHLALELLGVGQGDYVICSSFTFVASANPILYQKAVPIFVDSEPETWNMSPAALQKALEHLEEAGRQAKALILVNIYGQCADMDSILALCQEYHVVVIEDAAESIGAKYKGRFSGTFGTLAALSFNGNKIITTSGGGMLISNDQGLINRAKFLSTQAKDPGLFYQHSEAGYNYRLSNVLAGIGRGQIRVLPDRIQKRRAIFKRYQLAFGNRPDITWMPEPDGFESTHWLSACLLDKKEPEEVVQELLKENIEARLNFYPMHRQKLFKDCLFFSHHGDTSVSDHLFQRGICLPSGSGMTPEQQDRVIQTFKRILDN